MIGIPVNANSVFVPMVQTGCMKAEFDSTYPIHLNGIISQEEYRESIFRINHAVSPNKNILILLLVFGFGIIGGMVCFTVGGMTSVSSHTYGFPPFIAVGMGLTILTTIVFLVGAFIIQFQRAARIRAAVAEESMKYSSRSPTPCSWRLDTISYFVGTYGRRSNGQLSYNLVIDIGRYAAPGSMPYQSNQVATESASLFGRHDNYPPPAYSGQSTGFCSQCSAPRQDFTAKFCSSCGNSFNKY